jgi:hypothetical protein
MLAEIVRRGLWQADGASSPAAWLSWKVSMAGSTAREHVRVALGLADWPRVAAEFGAGRLSYSKVQVIVASDRPEPQDKLLEFAAYATGEQLHRTPTVARSRTTEGKTPVRVTPRIHDRNQPPRTRGSTPDQRPGRPTPMPGHPDFQNLDVHWRFQVHCDLQGCSVGVALPEIRRAWGWGMLNCGVRVTANC